MPINRPTLQDIVSRIDADMSSSLLNGSPILRRSFEWVTSRVLAAISHMFYGFLVWISRQQSPYTQDSIELERYADQWGVVRRSSQASVGSAIFTGTNGSNVPLGTVLQTATGIQFSTTEAGSISSGSCTVDIAAVIGGTSGNVDPSTPLSLISPLIGIQMSATVANAGTAGGGEAETDTGLRERLLSRLQKPPQGGSENDYVQWALEISGVYRAFCFPLYDHTNQTDNQPGNVGITFITADSENPVPLSTDQIVTNVRNNIATKGPITAIKTTYAPTKLDVPIDIELSDNSDSAWDAIVSEIRIMILREAAPGKKLLLSHLLIAIGSAVGNGDYHLNSPTDDIEVTKEQFPVFDEGNSVHIQL